MDGIIVINKPSGITSFDVIRKIRRITGIRKIGHTGTLDPEATGVLPICIGKATICSGFLLNKDKKYIAEMTLGSKTDTQDHTGKVTDTREVKVTEEQVLSVLEEFTGEIEQIPPVYSAIKVQGKKLYDLARRGELPEKPLDSRKIFIYSISNVKFIKESGFIKKVQFEVHCSKGTYIRTLCNDIGDRMGCFAHMSSLVRVQAGDFSIDKSYTLEEIEEMHNSNELSRALIPCDFVFGDYSKVYLKDADIRRYINGVSVKMYKLGYKPDFDAVAGDMVRIYSCTGKFIGLSKVDRDKHGFLLKPYKLFIRRDEYDSYTAK